MQVPEGGKMETFYINVPKAKGVKKPDRVEKFIGLFTPGKENAIKRSVLVSKCVEEGLIDSNCLDKDRAMRNIMARAKVDYNIKITNDGDGEGYYIPTYKESIQLEKNNKREDRKAISIFNNHKGNKALSEDYIAGRLHE